MTSTPAGPTGADGRQRPARALRPEPTEALRPEPTEALRPEPTGALRPGPARAFLPAAIAAFGTVRDTLAVLAWLAGMIIRPPVSPAGRGTRRR